MLKIKIILNETYVAFQETCYLEMEGYIICNIDAVGNASYCHDLLALQTNLNNNFIILDPNPQDREKTLDERVILYNTNTIRKIEPVMCS